VAKKRARMWVVRKLRGGGGGKNKKIPQPEICFDLWLEVLMSGRGTERAPFARSSLTSYFCFTRSRDSALARLCRKELLTVKLGTRFLLT